jgi:hypothetical protein
MFRDSLRPMRSVACMTVLFLLNSCTVSTSGTCQNPVVSACSDKAAKIADGLAKAAAQNGKTPDEMTSEFLSACEGQLQSDLDQTANDLLLITEDGGVRTP